MDPPPVPKWFSVILSAITAFAFVVLNVTSDARYHDELFWCLLVTILALIALATILHNEPDRGDRVRFIRLFFIVEVLIFVIGSVSAVFRWVHLGKRLW
jgi:hypothetical protein